MRPRLRPRPASNRGAWIRYGVGRFLQLVGLLITLEAAILFFGTPSTIAMLQTMLVGVCCFIPGWLLARKDPRGGQSS